MNPAQAFYGPPTISVGHTEKSVYDWDPFVLPRFDSSIRGSKDKSVPASVAAQHVTCITLHTYCFFWACEARPLAFSLAASAVSLARSVAVSAKVLDGVSPATEIQHRFLCM